MNKEKEGVCQHPLLRAAFSYMKMFSESERDSEVYRVACELSGGYLVIIKIFAENHQCHYWNWKRKTETNAGII
jgi:hypothetical protein